MRGRGTFQVERPDVPKHKGKMGHGAFLELQEGQDNYSSGKQPETKL